CRSCGCRRSFSAARTPTWCGVSGSRACVRSSACAGCRAGTSSPSSTRARALRRLPGRSTIFPALLQHPDVELDADHVGVHLERAPEPGERRCLVLEREMDLAEAGERAEVARVALQHLVAVGDRFPVVAGEVVDRGAAVPALRVIGFFPDHLAEERDGLVIPAGLHVL